MNINDIFNERLHRAREGKGLTMEELASRLKMNKSTIQRYESGTITNVKLPVVEAIAKVLDVNPDWLLGKTNNASIVNDQSADIVERIKNLSEEKLDKLEGYLDGLEDQ